MRGSAPALRDPHAYSGYRPGAAIAGVDVVGAAAGIWDLGAMLDDAAGSAAPRSGTKVRQWTAPTPLHTGPGKRVW